MFIWPPYGHFDMMTNYGIPSPHAKTPENTAFFPLHQVPGSNMILYDSLVFYGNGWMGFSWDSIYGVECNITISRFWNHSAKMHDHDIHGSTGCGFTHFSFFTQFGRSIPMYSHWLTNFQGGEATNEPPMLSINIPFCSELCTIHHTHTHTYIYIENVHILSFVGHIG